MSIAAGILSRLTTSSRSAVKVALAAVLFRRWTFGDRISADGYVRVKNEGTLRLGRLVDFRGGIVPTEIIVRPGAELVLGESTAVNYGVSIECSTRISLGKGCMLSKMVRIRDADGTRTAPITIGEGVWIAHGAFIEPGVTIGDGAVISAGSVVTQDVAPRTMAIGNPARSVPLAARGKPSGARAAEQGERPGGSTRER
jgi:maltose O-acetyltransferase